MEQQGIPAPAEAVDRLPAIRVISDALSGAILVVAGGSPCVARVASADPSGVGRFRYQMIDGCEHFNAGMLWPDYIPSPLRRYNVALALPANVLRPVDLLWVISGSTYIGTYRDAMYLWQPANTRQALVQLTTRQVRAALASGWVHAHRFDGATSHARGIRLSE